MKTNNNHPDLIGDKIHKLTQQAGFQHCEACEKRRLLLNALHAGVRELVKQTLTQRNK